MTTTNNRGCTPKRTMALKHFKLGVLHLEASLLEEMMAKVDLEHKKREEQYGVTKEDWKTPSDTFKDYWYTGAYALQHTTYEDALHCALTVLPKATFNSPGSLWMMDKLTMPPHYPAVEVVIGNAATGSCWSLCHVGSDIYLVMECTDRKGVLMRRKGLFSVLAALPGMAVSTWLPGKPPLTTFQWAAEDCAQEEQEALALEE